MEEAQKPDNEPNRIKAKTYDEFLVQLGVKKEKDLVGSFICTLRTVIDWFSFLEIVCMYLY